MIVRLSPLLTGVALSLAIAGPAPTIHATVACSVGPYVVFFEPGSAALNPEAIDLLERAVAADRACGAIMHIWLQGFTDSTGSRSANLLLSRQRTEMVQNYLMALGIAAARISTDAYGEDRPRVPTADGVREPINRRVEIAFSLPSASNGGS